MNSVCIATVYHVYNNVWVAAVELQCEYETRNTKDMLVLLLQGHHDGELLLLIYSSQKPVVDCT